MIEYADRSFLYGDALFETVRVTETGAHLLTEHLERFRRSATFFDFTTTQTDAGSRSIEKLADAEPGLWRVTVSRDCERYPMGGTCSIQSHRRDLPKRHRLRLISIRGSYFPGDKIAEHKTTSYVRNVEAKRRAKLAGSDDALLVSPDGLVGEASMANVFAIKNHVLVTPPIDGVLPGVTRAELMRVAKTHSMQVLEQRLSLDAILTAEEVFLTSSGVGVASVSEIDGVHFPMRFADKFNEWVHG